MMVGFEPNSSIYVVDLGSAGPDNEKVTIGSPWFWSPEIWMEPNHSQDKKDDVWALAQSIGEIEFTIKGFYPVDHESCIKIFSEMCQKELIGSLKKAFSHRRGDYSKDCGYKSADLFFETIQNGLEFSAAKRISSAQMVSNLQKASSLCTPLEDNSHQSNNIVSSFLPSQNGNSNNAQMSNPNVQKESSRLNNSKYSDRIEANCSGTHKALSSKNTHKNENRSHSSQFDGDIIEEFKKVLLFEPESDSHSQIIQPLNSNQSNILEHRKETEMGKNYNANSVKSKYPTNQSVNHNSALNQSHTQGRVNDPFKGSSSYLKSPAINRNDDQSDEFNQLIKLQQ